MRTPSRSDRPFSRHHASKGRPHSRYEFILTVWFGGEGTQGRAPFSSFVVRMLRGGARLFRIGMLAQAVLTYNVWDSE